MEFLSSLSLANLLDEPSYEQVGARFYPDGRVELLHRTRGTFGADFAVDSFPFDREHVGVEVVARAETADRVVFTANQSDIDFSDPPDQAPEGWDLHGVQVRRGTVAGWYGRSHSRVWVELVTSREAVRTIPAIFIPLLASLLIPFVSIWMNDVEEGEFKVDAFELANIIIGGLFALVALNFTVNSEYTALGGGGNPISELFALNYLTLGTAMAINLALFRYGVFGNWWGKCAQEQIFRVLTWAVPTLSLGTAVAIVLAAAA